jgi:hypothetical protein
VDFPSLPREWQALLVADWQPGWAFLYQVHGERLGPIRSDADHVHQAAKDCVRLGGGVATVLKAKGDGWVAVGTYSQPAATP